MIGKFSYTIEVQLLNFLANQENFFNDVTSNSLLDPANKPNEIVVITGIESFFSSVYAYSPSQRPVVTQANAANLAITFHVGQDDVHYQVPYNSFSTIINYGFIKEIEPSPINMSKSKIVVMGDLPDNTTSGMINFWYDVYTKDDYKKLQAAIVAYKLKYGRLDMSQIKL